MPQVHHKKLFFLYFSYLRYFSMAETQPPPSLEDKFFCVLGRFGICH
ncbi:hypothetical protein FBX98_104249 [Burkholderia sp. SJZ115]|nr:hypothetical protein FB600_104249 [Burkholderia sp. SJZ089]TWD05102.1 hypothetical protein FBX98_104249 [Burkholderia sp. SJZ115]TWD05364.1 hypothetical protein FB601_108108 [Burkholderia sp. SJZ091]